MKTVAVVCIVLGVIGLVLGIIARLGPGVIAGQGARTLGAGSGLCLLLAVALLMLEQKKQ